MFDLLSQIHVHTSVIQYNAIHTYWMNLQYPVYTMNGCRHNALYLFSILSPHEHFLSEAPIILWLSSLAVKVWVFHCQG